MNKHDTLYKKVVLKEFESSGDKGDILDLIYEPFTKAEQKILETHKCKFIKMDGKTVCTPGDEITLFKLNIKGKICYTAGDYDKAFVFKANAKVEDIIKFINNTFGLDELWD